MKTSRMGWNTPPMQYLKSLRPCQSCIKIIVYYQIDIAFHTNTIYLFLNNILRYLSIFIQLSGTYMKYIFNFLKRRIK